MKNVIMILFPLISIFLNQSTAYTWDNKITHKDISRYAAEYSILGPCNGNINQQCDYLRQFGFNLGLKEKFTWDNVTDFAKEWLARGAELEDTGSSSDAVTGKARFTNHFHNSRKPWAIAGLTDLQSGESALV